MDFILPPHCSICKRPLQPNEKVVCDECFFGIPAIVPPFCLRCGKTTKGFTVCNDCIEFPHEFSRLRAIAEYNGIIRDMVILFKTYRKTSLGKKLAQLMTTIIQYDETIKSADAVMPVPIHKVTLRERGYNQSQILANEISKLTGFPILVDILVQSKRTIPQKSFSSEKFGKQERRNQRAINVKNAFTIKESNLIKNKKIILIDDVCTTGATLDECAKKLVDAGADDVYAVVAARAH